MAEKSSTPSKESVERTKELGERTLDHQVNVIQEKGDTAIELIKINLLIASILIAVLEFGNTATESPDAVQKIVLSIVPLLVSILFAVAARVSSTSTFGLNSNGLSIVRSIDDRKGIEAISEAYVYWTEENRKQIIKADRFIYLSIGVTMVALGYLAAALFFLAR